MTQALDGAQSRASRSARPAPGGPPTRPLGVLLRAARGGGARLVLLAAASLAVGVGETVLPLVMGRAVDAALGRPVPGGATAWTVALTTVVVLAVACEAAGQRFGGSGPARGTAGLRRMLTAHVLAAGPGLTRRFPPGDVVSRLMGGAADAGAAGAVLATALTSVLPTLGAPVALALIDPWLALAFLCGLPAAALVLRTFARGSSAAVADYQRAQAAVAARLLDAFGGARTIAGAGTLDREFARILAPLAEMRSAGASTWRYAGRASAQSALLMPLLLVVVLAAAGLELMAGRIGPGELLAAGRYAALGAGIGGVTTLLGRLVRARVGAARAADLLAVPPRQHGAGELAPGPGRLEFRGVTVRTDTGAALSGLDLIVPAGLAVAIVGRSGSGKSMLAALAARLADPDEGEVLLDGVPLRGLGRRELRQAVQCAFARPAPLGGTVGAAIAFGVTDPSLERVEQAARAACAAAFIERLPGRYTTPLTASSLSGGELQRIGLARAFAHADRGRLLVLDDATSSLDTTTEMQVSRTITGTFGRCTRLVVAHRAATAARADLVVWLDGGRVIACGPHHELWERPAYREVFAGDAGRFG